MKVVNWWRETTWIQKVSLLLVIVILGYYFLVPIMIISQNRSKMVDKPSGDTKVGVVLGAGVNSKEEPSDALNDRLKVAAELYKSGELETIIVSGNNSAENNFETDVMARELEGLGVLSEDIYKDPDGNRTYDTCQRIQEVYGIEEVVVITQEFHLYRTMWLCENLGVEVEGVSATKRGYENGWYYKLREFHAIHKAIFDIYLIDPGYVEGDLEIDLQP